MKCVESRQTMKNYKNGVRIYYYKLLYIIQDPNYRSKGG